MCRHSFKLWLSYIYFYSIGEINVPSKFHTIKRIINCTETGHVISIAFLFTAKKVKNLFDLDFLKYKQKFLRFDLIWIFKNPHR